jgi:hypothetical protein
VLNLKLLQTLSSGKKGTDDINAQKDESSGCCGGKKEEEVLDIRLTSTLDPDTEDPDHELRGGSTCSCCGNICCCCRPNVKRFMSLCEDHNKSRDEVIVDIVVSGVVLTIMPEVSSGPK